MMRFARVASLLALALCLSAPLVQAQTPAPADGPFYADFTVAATLGHKSSGSVGAEAGYRIMEGLDVYFEGGRMMNVGTSDLDARAQLIANAVGATFSASTKANYFDAGVRWTPKTFWPAHPYVALGFGAAAVHTETVLSVNGNAVPPESLGVQLGTDLNGHATKGLFVLGFGATWPFAKQYFADFSYRYGRIFAKTSEIENDQGINTQRLQAGIGIRF